MILRFLFSFALLCIVTVPISGLTPDQECERCQVVLRSVYGHFSTDPPSQRTLRNQLKHECKRHFEYRRRCLMIMKDHVELVFREMKDTDEFKPIKPCLILKECKPFQSPIVSPINLEGSGWAPDEVEVAEEVPLPVTPSESDERRGSEEWNDTQPDIFSDIGSLTLG